MGRGSGKRIVYLLEFDERRRVGCRILLTKLLNWKAFRPAPIRRLADLMQVTYAEYLGEVDRRILSRMMYHETRNGATALLDGTDGFTLVQAMVETGRSFLDGGNRLRAVWGKPRKATPGWEQIPTGEWQTVFRMDPPSGQFIATQPPCYVDLQASPNCIGPIESEWPVKLASDWVRTAPVDEEGAAAFCLKLFNRYPDQMVPTPDGVAGAAEVSLPPVPRLRLLRRDAGTPLAAGTLHELRELAMARLSFRYGPREVSWDDDRPTVSFEEKGRLHRCRRDLEAERQARLRLEETGFESKSDETQAMLFDFHRSDFQLRAEAPHSWYDLLNHILPALRESGWEVVFDADFDLEVPKSSDWFAQVRKSRSEWLSFSAGIQIGKRRIQVLPIMREFLRAHRTEPFPELRKRFAETTFVLAPGESAGATLLVSGEALVGLLDALFELRGSSLDERGAMRVSRWRAAELILETGADGPADLEIDRIERLRKYLGSQRELTPPPNLPKTLQPLRGYQLTGLGWMEFLRETGTHGILADDMGLGKTRQILVHLLHEKNVKRLSGRALIVAPTSVIDTWIAEARAHTPDLTVHRHHGGDREAHWETAMEADLVVTSYPLLRQDADRLGETEWAFVVLDEAQAIKNPISQTARVAGALKAERKLCLSGTPIENHLGELWSLFHFLMPGFLGTADAFRDMFRRPIEDAEANGDAGRMTDLLSRRIAPFILRRRKEDVARELPPKTEMTHAIELAPRQSHAYEALRIRLFEDIRKVLEERGVEQSQVFILDALLQLRLICCDPRLARGDAESDYGAEDSAKLQRLLEMLEELLAEGRRVLVFSQFVRMLDLVGAAMQERDWAFLSFTGQTKDRARVTQAFQQGEAPVLLISLKAGGVGLNLTAADTVIHYDPWWNPAVEAQATDRAHRIGQDNPVFVHRLIADGTVENKMLDLHARKRALVDSLLAGKSGERVILDEEALSKLFS